MANCVRAVLTTIVGENRNYVREYRRPGAAARAGMVFYESADVVGPWPCAHSGNVLLFRYWVR